jgi:hypothetical protein
MFFSRFLSIPRLSSLMTKPFRTSYSDRPELEKLSALRAKTERQVLSLIQSKLALGLNFVALVEQTYLGESRDAEQLLRHAEQSVIEVKQLLPVLTDAQHQSVGPPLNELQEALERLRRNRERPRSATATMS